MQTNKQNKPTIFVSGCLLGQEIRFDGGHKRNRYVADELSQVLNFQPICPEVESGMTVPRPTIHLRNIENEIRLTESNNKDRDFTDNMLKIAHKKAQQSVNKISGMIVQKKSPSCGLERVAVSNSEGKTIHNKGVGLFTENFMKINPLVPVEEDGRLNDPVLRENFLERVYSLNRWYQLEGDNVTEFINFHAQHKFMLMARGKIGYAKLGRIVSDVTNENLNSRKETYIKLFMETLKEQVERKHHFNVMQHIMGYFKQALTKDDKKELLEVMQSYKCLQVPLATPIILIKHYLRKYPDSYLSKQYYLKPYPDSLALRALV